MQALADKFHPFSELAIQLLPHVVGDDAAHDYGHLLRVWKNVIRIHAVEGGDLEVLCASVILHDAVQVEKSSPLRSHASRLAAQKASEILSELNWSPDRIASVALAIEAHSFSADLEATTLEARILQDADRLDAIGAIGIARCFYVSGRLGRSLYDLDDPGAANRMLDDTRFSLDHIERKLLLHWPTFKTDEGKLQAKVRHDRLRDFMNDFLGEVHFVPLK